MPSDVVTADIDPETRTARDARAVPARMTEVFISGTAPTQECPLHGGSASRSEFVAVW